MLAIKKPRTSFSIPEPLIQEFRALADPVGEKRHWLVISAAILLLVDAGPAVQQVVMAKVASADIGMGGYEDLIAKAKGGELRAEIDAVEAKAGRRNKGRAGAAENKG